MKEVSSESSLESFLKKTAEEKEKQLESRMKPNEYEKFSIIGESSVPTTDAPTSGAPAGGALFGTPNGSGGIAIRGKVTVAIEGAQYILTPKTIDGKNYTLDITKG